MAKKTFLWVLLIAAIGTEILSVFMYMMAEEQAISDTVEFLTYTNTQIVIWAILCTVCFALTMSSFGLKSMPGKVWLFLTIGVASWAIGDLLYMYYQVIEQLPEELLFPTVADYFWTVGYLFVFVGILLQMRLASVKLTKKEVIIVNIIVAVSSVLSAFYVIWPVLEQDLLLYEYTMEYWVFSLIYPVLDLVLIPLAIVLALKYRGGEFSKAWLILAIGLVVTAIYDLLYTYFEILGAGYILFTDTIYLGYYMLLALGALYLRSSVQSLNK